MNLKEHIKDFFHMIYEYIDFQFDSIREVDFIGDTKEEVFNHYVEWINSNRFRRKYHHIELQ